MREEIHPVPDGQGITDGIIPEYSPMFSWAEAVNVPPASETSISAETEERQHFEQFINSSCRHLCSSEHQAWNHPTLNLSGKKKGRQKVTFLHVPSKSHLSARLHRHEPRSCAFYRVKYLQTPGG